LDTRSKIIEAAEMRERIVAEGLAVVQLDCDPLLLSVVERLPVPCAVYVAARENEYLPQRARAELAASLAAVRWVALGLGEGATDLRGAEAAARAALEQLVLTKSRGA
jgi:hypothetical protein